MSAMDATDYNELIYKQSLKPDEHLFHMDWNSHLYNERNEQYFYLTISKSHEQVLSQSLSQLSIEKMSTTLDHDVPYYLSVQCGLFDQMIVNHIELMSCSYNVDELRTFACSVHEIEHCQLYEELWHKYQLIGTGQLQLDDPLLKHHHYQSYWPEHIKTFTTVNGIHHIEQFIQQRLRHYRDTRQKIQMKLCHVPSNVQQKLHEFINHHGLVDLRLQCQFAMALVENQYRDVQYHSLFQMKNNNVNQIQRAIYLFDLEYQLEQMKLQFFIDRQTIRFNQPSTIYDALEISIPSWLETYRQQFETMIQRTKTQLILLDLMAIEQNIHQLQTKFNGERHDICMNEKRSTLLHERFEIKSNFYVQYYLQHSFDSSTKAVQLRTGFTNHLIIDSCLTSKPTLTHDQMKLLNRGPSYVAPGQLQCLSSAQSKETIVNEQFKLFDKNMSKLFETHRIELFALMDFQEKIKKEFFTSFSIPTPSTLQQRATHEDKQIQSIRTMFEQRQLVIRRTADHENLFYLTDRTQFDEACQQFMIEHQDDFQCLFPMNDRHRYNSFEKLKLIIGKLNEKLTRLVDQKKISKEVYRRLYISDLKVQLGFLTFLPDLPSYQFNDGHLHHTSVRPIFCMNESFAWHIGQYIYDVLRSTALALFDSTKVIQNESDFIEKFHQYATIQQQLRPTTRLVRIKITNFVDMFSNDSICNRIGHALDMFMGSKLISDLSITTIETLIELFLQSNLFYYDEQIYRLQYGLYPSCPLHTLLLNLALFNWQKVILDDDHVKNEFLVRCNDELLMTWNHSESELETLIENLQYKYPDIHLTVNSGQALHYQQIYLENRHGHLYTCVYHPTEMYSKLILPYAIQHATMTHQHWFRLSLCRALQVCSNVMDFQRERLILEMACLSYGYSIDFIDMELNHFYQYFDADKFRYNLNAQVYEKLRKRALTLIDAKRRIIEEQHQLEDHNYFIDFPYFYDHGNSIEFQQQFLQQWSTAMSARFAILKDKRKVLFHPYHVFSLHTRLTTNDSISKIRFNC